MFNWISILFICGVCQLILFNKAQAAGVFRITNRTYGNVSDPTITNQIDQIFDLMETQVNTQLTQFDASTYLEGTANATALASAGGTHDVANRFNYLFVSAGFGAAADLGGQSFSDIANGNTDINTLNGLSGNMNMTLGASGRFLNLPKTGWLQPENLKIYLSYSQLSQTVDSVSFEHQSYGLMFQYHFLGHYSLLKGALKWHGVDFTTGYKMNRIQVLFSKAFNQTIQQTINDGILDHTMTMNYSTVADLGANANISTIPLEASTSIGLLYFLDTFLGIGTDINFGTAKSVISAPGQVTATEDSNTLGTMGGNVEFDLGQSGKPQAMNSRYLVGVALDFRIASLSIQYNHNVTNSAESVHIDLGAHF